MNIRFWFSKHIAQIRVFFCRSGSELSGKKEGMKVRANEKRGTRREFGKDFEERVRKGREKERRKEGRVEENTKVGVKKEEVMKTIKRFTVIISVRP